MTDPSHIDDRKPDNSPGTGTYDGKGEYESRSDKEGLGPVEDRGWDIDVSHPVSDVDELFETIHLAGLFHHNNREKWETQSDFPNDGGKLFDRTVLTVADDCFADEDIYPDELDIITRRLYAIFLKKARCFTKVKPFYRYFKEADHVHPIIGYESIAPRGYDTWLRECNNLGDLEGPLERASHRAVFSVFRNGVVPPKRVRDQLGFDEVYNFDDNCPCFHERSLDREQEKQALRRWITTLADSTLDPLTLNRDQTQTTFEIIDFLGLAATSALTTSGLQTAAKISDYHYDRDNIPKGSGFPKYIKNLEFEFWDSQSQSPLSINDQWDAVHNKTLSLAHELGFLADPVSIAIDTYHIDWTGYKSAPVINRPGRFDDDVRSQWTFVVIGILNKEERFTLGTRLIERKHNIPLAAEQILANSSDYVDIDGIYVDAGMVSGALIDKCHTRAGSNWFIKAPDRELMENLKRYTPKNYIGYIPSVSFNAMTDPSLIAYPDDDTQPEIVRFSQTQLTDEVTTEALSGQSSLSTYGDAQDSTTTDLPPVTDEFGDLDSAPGVGDMSTHTAYFSGQSSPLLTRSDEDSEDTDLDYNQRWAVEEAINQIKNDFLFVCESSEPKLQLYAANTALLFQNWHTMINRATSPKYGYRLSPPHQELLTAIQDVAFSQ